MIIIFFFGKLKTDTGDSKWNIHEKRQLHFNTWYLHVCGVIAIHKTLFIFKKVLAICRIFN